MLYQEEEMPDQSVKQVDEAVVREVIDSKNIHTYFQPVVSISTKSIVGFEAYSKGGGGDVCVIDPAQLFHSDLNPNLKVDVDRLCREKALGQFSPIHVNYKEMLLFLNINPAILAHVNIGSQVLQKQVASMGIDVKNIVLECPLGRVNNEEVLDFACRYKEFGFRIGLDNCSVDDSFNPAIASLKPDYIKVNRSFYAKDVRTDYSATMLGSIIEAADRVGAMVIAQGVESEDDSIRLLTAGVHLQQGYYYTKDEDVTTGDPAKMFFQKIFATYDKYKKVKRKLVRRKKERFDMTFKTVNSLCSKFANMTEDRFEASCLSFVSRFPEVVSIFVLDEAGEQMTVRAHVKSAEGREKSSKVLGMTKGVNHSVHDYVLYLDMGYEKFVTQPFTSHFTGAEVCIISKPFYNCEGERYIVCIEMPYPG